MKILARATRAPIFCQAHKKTLWCVIGLDESWVELEPQLDLVFGDRIDKACPPVGLTIYYVARTVSRQEVS